MACVVTLEVLTSRCGVEERVLDEEVASAQYCEIARHLSQWKRIAPRLGFTDNEVDSVDADNLKAEEKRVSFLKAWKQKFAIFATYRVLVGALLGIQRVEDARGIICGIPKGI
jgi:hypothetical protein